VLYTTTQTHSLGAKAALILGVRCRALEVRAEDGWALRGETLAAALKEDAEQGLSSFILSALLAFSPYRRSADEEICFAVATVGTTSSGAVDRVDEIGPIRVFHLSSRVKKSFSCLLLLDLSQTTSRRVAPYRRRLGWCRSRMPRASGGPPITRN
jgi:hypothetical protein